MLTRQIVRSKRRREERSTKEPHLVIHATGQHARTLLDRVGGQPPEEPLAQQLETGCWSLLREFQCRRVSSTMSSHKVYVHANSLVLGPCDGNPRTLVDKVAAIEAKHGPFTAAFVVGDLYGDGTTDDEKKLSDGTLKRMWLLTVPIPTYFFYGTRSLPDGIPAHSDADSTVEVAPNLHYLGSAGIVNVQGFRVAFCGGAPGLYAHASPHGDSAGRVWAPLDSADALGRALHMLKEHPDMTLGDASLHKGEPTTLAEARAQHSQKDEREALIARDAETLQQRRPIDFLLTTCWPRGIDKFNSAALPDGAHSWGASTVARLAERARPRYHFSIAPEGNIGAFWERDPYENPPFASAPGPPSITRFVSLAKAANTAKLRWFMALSMIPAGRLDPKMHPAAFARPSNLTPSPVLPQPKRDRPAQEDNVRFGAPEKRHRVARRRRDAAPVNPDQCWFCLSNPRIEKVCLY